MIPQDHPSTSGFTLLETSIVLFIIALLLGGLLPTLSARVEQQRINEVRAQMDDIQQAVIGFTIANGRLPCPASQSSHGAESYGPGGNAGNGDCSNFYDGYVPAVTLGLVTVDGQGYAIDPWGNRIHYAVTSWNNNTYTSTNGMKASGISALAPNLLVCSTASGISAIACASGTALTASPGVPAVVYSTGKNGSYGGASADEAANPNPNSSNNDRVFVSHPPSSAASANGEFDDFVIWLSPNILFNRLVEAGKLP